MSSQGSASSARTTGSQVPMEQDASQQQQQQQHREPSPPADRNRGGFRRPELRTIPEHVTSTLVQNIGNMRPCDIMANYVPIETKLDTHLQTYRIDFEPSIESAARMRQMFRKAAKQYFERVPMYDGVHECRSVQKLPEKVTKFCDDEAEITVTLTHTGMTAMGTEMVRTYNIHMKTFFHQLKFFQPQPGLHVHPAHAFNVGEDIMILRGFRTAANIHDEGKLLMMFEAAHKLIQRQNVCEVMHQIRRNSPGGDFREAIKSEMTGKLVVTSYNKRAYRVEEVDFDTNPQSKFSKRDGTEISYIEYFKNAYNYDVKDKLQPLLVVIPSNKRRRGDEEKDREIRLVPEMCNIAGLTEQQRNNNKLKMDLIRASQISPNDRVEHLRAFLKKFHENEDIQKQLNDWCYTYGKEPLKLKGHTIAPTMIGTGQAAKMPTKDWQRSKPDSADFNVNAMAECPMISRMVVIIGRIDLPMKNKIMTNLKAGFDRIQLRVGHVEILDMNEGDQAAHYARRLRALSPLSTDLAVVILHNQNKTSYAAVKKAASTELGLITQVVTARLISDDRKAHSAAAKIAIQIAAKVGGQPWWVDIPLKKSMVCGYDTYHDTASRGRSFGAFLASMNDKYSKWFSKADQHDKLDDVSTQVSVNMAEALQQYKSLNGELPERVIIYRDGVSEGQLEFVFKTELIRLQEKIKAIGSDIKLTMIIVNKKVGARFYMRTGDNKFANPTPGTVIDHGATRADRYDFYLISQSTRQGTISPTYYNIIFDESGFTPEIHQKMAFKFCSIYYNWSGTVRVPAPCQYARKLAILCGEHLHASPNATLNDRLHFL